MSVRQYKYAALIACQLLLLSLGTAAAHTIDADKSAAVIFVYQRVGEDALPNSSISIEKFKEHIQSIKRNGYNVLSIGQVIDSLKAGKPLPAKTIALTFEGGWLSTYRNALPLLDAAELPYTLFFATDMAAEDYPTHIGWREIKALRKNRRVTLGILPSGYIEMADMDVETATTFINKAVSRYRDELGEAPLYFAYPYGEYTPAIKRRIADYAFKAAFAQQSGVAHGKSDFMALPRFTMTDIYGDLDRFELTANALPLPVHDLVPENMLIRNDTAAGDGFISVGFTVTPEITDLARLSCFVSGVGKIDLQKPGGNRVEMRVDYPLGDRSTRINCTIPDETTIPGQTQSWRWFGMQMIDKDYISRHDEQNAATDAETPLPPDNN